MSERKDVKTLHVELPAAEFDLLKSKADESHRTLRGEVRRVIRDAYGITEENEQEQPTADKAVAV